MKLQNPRVIHPPLHSYKCRFRHGAPVARLTQQQTPRESLEEEHDGRNQHDGTAQVGSAVAATEATRLGLLGGTRDDDGRDSGRNDGDSARGAGHHGVVGGRVGRHLNLDRLGRGGSLAGCLEDDLGEGACGGDEGDDWGFLDEVRDSDCDNRLVSSESLLNCGQLCDGAHVLRGWEEVRNSDDSVEASSDREARVDLSDSEGFARDGSIGEATGEGPVGLDVSHSRGVARNRGIGKTRGDREISLDVGDGVRASRNRSIRETAGEGKLSLDVGDSGGLADHGRLREGSRRGREVLTGNRNDGDSETLSHGDDLDLANLGGALDGGNRDGNMDLLRDGNVGGASDSLNLGKDVVSAAGGVDSGEFRLGFGHCPRFDVRAE